MRRDGVIPFMAQLNRSSILMFQGGALIDRSSRLHDNQNGTSLCLFASRVMASLSIT